MTITTLIAQVRDRLSKATPGPWTSSRDLMTFHVSRNTNECEYVCHMEEGDYGKHDSQTFNKRWKNSCFIASAPTDLRLLTDALEKAVQALKVVAKEWGTDYCDGHTMIAHEAIKEIEQLINNNGRND